MRRTKTLRWQENLERANVHQPDIQEIARGGRYNQGQWAEVLGAPGPLALELGCGGGETTLALARQNETRGVIGVDVKGHRFWEGAKIAEEEGLSHVAFLRARIEYIDHYFAPAEVGQVWLTFSDPQPKDEKGTKRITSPVFLRRYRRILSGSGTVHVKTDSELIYERTREEAHEADFRVVRSSEDVHGSFLEEIPESLAEVLRTQSRYEERWRREGKLIHYLELEQV